MSCKCLCVAFFVFPQKCACVFSFRNLSVSITKRKNIGHGSANWPKSTQKKKTRKMVQLHLLWEAHLVFKQDHVYSSTPQIGCSKNIFIKLSMKIHITRFQNNTASSEPKAAKFLSDSVTQNNYIFWILSA